ncbi:MAG: FAD-binding oxidoreductase [Gemmatimonadaceae bacterium]
MRPEHFRGIYRDDILARSVYAEGAGIARMLPAAIAAPADAEDVMVLVRWASETGTPIIPRGSGSGMAGGAVGSGVIVDLSRLDVIEPVDEAHRHLWAGPGAIRGEVDRRARAHGLRFPVDPSSGAFCTVGGMAATNAAGARSLRYGSMRRWVTALDCVFDDGTRATIRRGAAPPALIRAVECFGSQVEPWLRMEEHTVAHARAALRKQSSGYALAAYLRSGDILDLLLGSEGTLALFVGVELALEPLAGATSSVLAAYRTLEDAVDGASRAREGGASACELLDRTFLDFATRASSSLLLPAGTEAVLLIEMEAESATAAARAGRAMGDALGEGGASMISLALDPETELALWGLRHAASPILSRLDPSLKSMQFIEDGCVPPDRLAEYVRGVRAALDRRGIRGVIFGHAGDGHVHVNPLIDVGRPRWRAELTEVLHEVSELVERLGGTLAGEHGDGRLRTPLLGRGLESFFGMMVKRCFDPNGILNPGVKVALPGQQPIGDVKYDAALPPLPPAARAVLDRVERERAYARFRLALLDEPA